MLLILAVRFLRGAKLALRARELADWLYPATAL
jgi:hypothetical protein